MKNTRRYMNTVLKALVIHTADDRSNINWDEASKVYTQLGCNPHGLTLQDRLERLGIFTDYTGKRGVAIDLYKMVDVIEKEANTPQTNSWANNARAIIKVVDDREVEFEKSVNERNEKWALSPEADTNQVQLLRELAADRKAEREEYKLRTESVETTSSIVDEVIAEVIAEQAVELNIYDEPVEQAVEQPIEQPIMQAELTFKDITTFVKKAVVKELKSINIRHITYTLLSICYMLFIMLGMLINQVDIHTASGVIIGSCIGIAVTIKTLETNRLNRLTLGAV